LEKVISKFKINRGGTIFNRTLQYFAYAADVTLVRGKSQELKEAFQQIDRPSNRAGLKINLVKTKYIINTRNKIRFRNFKNLRPDNYTLQSVDEVKHLGVVKNNKVKSEKKSE
jgi:hypothetical protein